MSFWDEAVKFNKLTDVFQLQEDTVIMAVNSCNETTRQLVLNVTILTRLCYKANSEDLNLRRHITLQNNHC